MLINRNDILKYVDRNYYLEDEGGQIRLYCFYNVRKQNADFVRYSVPVDFSNEDLSFRKKQIESAKGEVVGKIIRDLE